MMQLTEDSGNMRCSQQVEMLRIILFGPFFILCASFLCKGHANLLHIVLTLLDVPTRTAGNYLIVG